MINAQSTNTRLGMTPEHMPVVQFEFQYFKEGESTPSKAATRCIFLLNSDSETLDNSSMARSLVTLFMIAGAPTWNDILGKVVRIEVNEQGIVTRLQNALSDLYITLTIPEEESEKDSSVTAE